jgi:hypothetical protein
MLMAYFLSHQLRLAQFHRLLNRRFYQRHLMQKNFPHRHRQ